MAVPHTPRITNYETNVYVLIQQESARRRNGGRGFSRTVNQMLLEWLDAYNAGILPFDARPVQTLPAVQAITTE